MIVLTSLMNAEYQDDECEQAYKDLLENPGDAKLVERALELSLPILGWVMRTKFKNVKYGTEEHEEILSTVPFKLFKYLSGRSTFHERYYIDGKTHKSFLFGWFRLEILTVLGKVRRQENKRREADFPSIQAYDPNTSSSTIECKTFVRELPRYVLDKAKDRIRIMNEEHRKLCVLMLERRISSKPIPDYLRGRWDITQNEFDFLDEYVHVLIRSVLLESQKMISRIPYTFQEERYSDYDALNSNMTMHGALEHWR